MQHVAIGDGIILALKPELTRLARTRFAVRGDIIRISDGLGADKALFEIGVDDARGLRRLGADFNGPGTGFLRADREIGDEMQERVASTDDAIEPRLVQPDSFEII